MVLFAKLIPRCHDIVTAERSKLRKPKFLKRHRFGYITEREIAENVIRSVPKNTKKSKNIIWREFMSFCAVKKSTFDRETPILVSSILYFYSRNILPKYQLYLKINRTIFSFKLVV
jgi:hypothetical protein